MLKPDYFYGKSDAVISYYQDLEDYLLNDIAKFLIKSGEIGGKADRELFILQQMGMKDARITKKLAEISGKSRNSVRSILKDSVMTSFSNDKEVLDKYFSGDYGPLNNPAIVDVLDAEWKKTCGELDNLTRTTMSQYNMDVVNLLNEAEIRTASGVSSYSQAVCDVLDNYAATGMIINYPTGARKTLESAVRCAVVTSMNQTAAQVTNKYIAEGGIEYVLVSAHTGARHSDKGGLFSHDEWQGKAYKIVGEEEGYPNLLESTGYNIDPVTGNGEVINPAGLHGYNCRHSHQPWDKDLENPWIKPDGTPRIDPEKSRIKYEQQQKQRGMERGIRSTKRQLNMKQTELNALPNGEIKDKAQADYDKLAYKLKERNKAYSEYCAENNLTKQSDRIKVAGFNEAELKQANKAAKRYTEPKAVEVEEYVKDGVTYKVDGVNVIMDPSESERANAQLLAEYMGCDVGLLPKVQNPRNIKTPDYIINGVEYDLKEPTGGSKDLIYNIAHKHKEQTSNFVFDISKNEHYSEEEIINQIEERIYKNRLANFVDNVILINHGKVIREFKRNK